MTSDFNDDNYTVEMLTTSRRHTISTPTRNSFFDSASGSPNTSTNKRRGNFMSILTSRFNLRRNMNTGHNKTTLLTTSTQTLNLRNLLNLNRRSSHNHHQPSPQPQAPSHHHQHEEKSENKLLAAALVRPHPSRILRGRRRSDRGNNGKDPEKMAILIRSDMKLSTGRIIHFSTSIALRLFQRVCSIHNNNTNNNCTTWSKNGQKKVVYGVIDETKMNSIIKHARQLDVAVAGVRVRIAPKKSERGRSRSKGRSSSGKGGKSLTVSNNQNQKDQQSTNGHVWVAVGVFGPTAVVNKMTRHLPEI